ncbi:hypothetical protein CRYUN_Cryun27aG0106800 [Craigia yunnanensis]
MSFGFQIKKKNPTSDSKKKKMLGGATAATVSLMQEISSHPPCIEYGLICLQLLKSLRSCFLKNYINSFSRRKKLARVLLSDTCSVPESKPHVILG